MLDWEGCVNVRDLGGLPTADGRTTRPGALVRADSLTRLTAVGCASARAHGVSAVIDLRSGPELADGQPVIRRLPTGPVLDTAGPHPFCALHGVVYRQMRLRDYSDEEFAERVRGLTSQLDVYRTILRDGAPAFARITRTLVEAPPGAVVVHCAIGRDRTGMTIAVLLSALGVPTEVVAADYAQSEQGLRPMIEFRQTLGLPVQRFNPDDDLCSPEWMLTLLSELGDAADYLRAGGLTDEELAALRRRLVG